MCTNTARLVLFQVPGNEDDLVGRMCILHGLKTIRARNFLPTVVHNLNNSAGFTCSFNERECPVHAWLDCPCSGHPDYKVPIMLVVPEERGAYRRQLAERAAR